MYILQVFHFWFMLLFKPEEELLKLFGQNVRRIRKEKMLSMEQLANLADIEISQVYRIENGRINSKIITVIALANALEIDAGEFFKLEG
jgi:transcriptional regulator with XRE-family HTH domain